MEERRQRRSLSARGHIGGTEIGYDIEPEPLRQQRAVTYLPGSALGRAMQDRVAVKPDDVDWSPIVSAQEMLDCVGVKLG